jgi:hypothetical protein
MEDTSNNSGFLPLVENFAKKLRFTKLYGLSGHEVPVNFRLGGTMAATKANYNGLFFIAERPCKIVAIYERHETKGTDGSGVFLYLNIVPDGVATTGAGMREVNNTGFDMKGTNSTIQSRFLSDGGINPTSNTMNVGDGLTLYPSGTFTSVANVCVTVIIKYI